MPAKSRRIVPDAEYMRNEIPMTDVAQKLGLAVRGRWVRCPQDQGHWARIWLRKNKLKCFKCGSRAMTTIDLVMNSLQMDVNHAIKWLAARFAVPMRRRRITTNLRGTTKHRYVDYPPCKRPRNLEPSVELLRRAPAYASLTPTARRLAAYLIEQTPRESLTSNLTYRELQVQIDTGNRGTITRALEQLREAGLVETGREASSTEGFTHYAAKTVVRLTWGSSRFQEFLSAHRRTATRFIGSKLNHGADTKVNHKEQEANRHKSEPRVSDEKPMKTEADSADEKACFGEFERAVRQLAHDGMIDLHEISLAACQRTHDAGGKFPFNALGAVRNILNWQPEEGARLQ